MLAKTFRQILRVISLRHAGRGVLHHLLSGCLQRFLKAGRRQLLASMDDGKQFPQRGETRRP